MIIVTGTVVARAETLEALLDLCLQHVRRSRAEPGCLLHRVHQDVEEPSRIQFLEHWADAAALRTHFEVPVSLDFVNAVTALAAEPPSLEVYEAARISV